MTFEKRKIGDVVDEITVGHVGPMADQYVATGIPFLRSLNIKPYQIDLADLKFISAAFHSKLKKSALRPGDVVIVRTGKPGTCTVIPDWLSDANCSDLVIVRCGKKIYPRYLAYWVNSLATHHIGSSLVGAVQQHFNVGAAREMPILLPSLTEQGQILDVLASLDDKIELNRQTNQTIETLAKAIFKDWFVDFGPVLRKKEGATNQVEILGGLLLDRLRGENVASLFPDNLAENGVPKGWQVRTLGDLVEPRKGKSITMKVVVPGTVPVVAGGLKPAYFHNIANVVGPVITISASGANAGFVRLYNQDIWASDCSYINREHTDYIFTLYSFLSSRQHEIYSMQQGAAQPHIYPSDLKRLEICDAPREVWEASETLLTPMFEMIANNEKESEILAAAREYLAPKLMSGEVRVREGGRHDKMANA